MNCPKCSHNLSLLDVSRQFNCPKCQTLLSTHGWGVVTTVEILLFIIAGEIMISAWLSSGWLAGLGVGLAWVVIEWKLRKKLLKVEVVEVQESPKESHGEAI